MLMGTIVQALAGHDSGRYFCVIGEEGEFLLLCDGKRRKLQNPKKKRRKHTLAAGEFHHPTLEKLRRREPVTDNEIRKAIAAFRTAKEV